MIANRNRAPRILIIENEPLIAEIIAEMILNLGYVVSGMVHTIAGARQELSKHNFDTALLDIRLPDGKCVEIADELVESGVPIAFITGYERVLEPRHQHVPLLHKPCTVEQLDVLLRNLVGPAPATDEFGKAS